MIAKSKRTRAAGYIRMSGDHQERSPAQQKAELTALAKREGLEVVAWFDDAATSGDTGADERPGLARMLAAAEAGDFEVLLLWDSDRLSRRTPLAAAADVYRLQCADVEMLTPSGRIDFADFGDTLRWFIEQEENEKFLAQALEKNPARVEGFSEGRGLLRRQVYSVRVRQG